MTNFDTVWYLKCYSKSIITKHVSLNLIDFIIEQHRSNQSVKTFLKSNEFFDWIKNRHKMGLLQNHPSGLLSPIENRTIFRMLGDRLQSLSTVVAKLFVAEKGKNKLRSDAVFLSLDALNSTVLKEPFWVDSKGCTGPFSRQKVQICPQHLSWNWFKIFPITVNNNKKVEK